MCSVLYQYLNIAVLILQPLFRTFVLFLLKSIAQ